MLHMSTWAPPYLYVAHVYMSSTIPICCTCLHELHHTYMLHMHVTIYLSVCIYTVRGFSFSMIRYNRYNQFYYYSIMAFHLLLLYNIIYIYIYIYNYIYIFFYFFLFFFNIIWQSRERKKKIIYIYLYCYICVYTYHIKDCYHFLCGSQAQALQFINL